MRFVLGDLGPRKMDDSRVVWEGLPMQQETSESNTSGLAIKLTYAAVGDGKYSVIVDV